MSNINCVRQDRSVNIEGFEADDLTVVRFINSSNELLEKITGSLYDVEGNLIGTANAELIKSLAPKAQSWMNRNDLASFFGSEGKGEAMLEVDNSDGLKLMNINFAGAAPSTLHFDSA